MDIKSLSGSILVPVDFSENHERALASDCTSDPEPDPDRRVKGLRPAESPKLFLDWRDVLDCHQFG